MNPCSWCLEEKGIEPGNGSHGICRYHELMELDRVGDLRLLEKFELSFRAAWRDPEVQVFAGALFAAAIVLYLSATLILTRHEKFKIEAELVAQTLRAEMAIVARERMRAELKGDTRAYEIAGIESIYYNTSAPPTIARCSPYSACVGY